MIFGGVTAKFVQNWRDEVEELNLHKKFKLSDFKLWVGKGI